MTQTENDHFKLAHNYLWSSMNTTGSTEVIYNTEMKKPCLNTWETADISAVTENKWLPLKGS